MKKDNLIMENWKIGKKGQEEIVGFALIIIIVAVVILFMLSFSLRSSNKENVESYEIDSFITSSLQYSTDCEVNSKGTSVEDLIYECSDNTSCDDERNSCEVLNSTLKDIVYGSWKTGEERVVKGYNFVVSESGAEMVSFFEGNETRNYKGGIHSLPGSIEISLKVYY